MNHLVPFWFTIIAVLWTGFVLEGFDFGVGTLHDAAGWRRTWGALLTVGSVLAPPLIGIALGGILYGLPINSAGNYTGSFADLFPPYALFTGVTLVAACAPPGAKFLSLETTGDMQQRARQVARYAAPVTCALVTGFAIASCIVSIFTGLYPHVMASTTRGADNLTVHHTASGPYALKVMTVVVIILLPVVLAYQAWTYHIFRHRVSRSDFQPASPASTPPGPRPGVTPDGATPASPPWNLTGLIAHIGTEGI
jgi:cytochrome bd ubiquinol oxidase subunit II